MDTHTVWLEDGEKTTIQPTSLVDNSSGTSTVKAHPLYSVLERTQVVPHPPGHSPSQKYCSPGWQAGGVQTGMNSFSFPPAFEIAWQAALANDRISRVKKTGCFL